MGADCKSAARATLVQIQLGPFTMVSASWSFFRTHSSHSCLYSSVVEHFIGNEEVTGSNPVGGLFHGRKYSSAFGGSNRTLESCFVLPIGVLAVEVSLTSVSPFGEATPTG
jgi:hypothetical protein